MRFALCPVKENVFFFYKEINFYFLLRIKLVGWLGNCGVLTDDCFFLVECWK